MYCCFQGYGRPGEIPDHHQTILQTSAGITSLTGTLTHTFTHAALWSHEAAPQRRPELQNPPLPLPEMDFKQLRWQRLQWFSPSWSDFLICLGSAFAPLLQGIFLVYDITSERSFQHIMKWASDVDEVSLEIFPNTWLMLPWSHQDVPVFILTFEDVLSSVLQEQVFPLVVRFDLCLDEAVSYPASSWSPARWFNCINLVIKDLISSWVLS